MESGTGKVSIDNLRFTINSLYGYSVSNEERKVYSVSKSISFKNSMRNFHQNSTLCKCELLIAIYMTKFLIKYTKNMRLIP
jgi:hypothetical protein